MYSCEYITETRNFCEFRKNMIQVANKPFDEVDFKWLVCCVFGAWRQKYMYYCDYNQKSALAEVNHT